MASQAPDLSVLLPQADAAMRARNYRVAANLLERCIAAGAADVGLFFRLAAARRAVGDAAGALDPVSAILKREPRNFVAWLMGGSLLSALGRSGEAARAYRTALEIAPPPAAIPPSYAQELEVARQHVAREQGWRRSVAELDLDSVAGTLEAGERRRLEQLRTSIVVEEKSAEGIEFVYPALPAVGFYDPADFAGVAALEQATTVITAEYRAVAALQTSARVSMAAHAGAIAAGHDVGTESRQWSSIPLIADGAIVAANAALCPETMRLYEALRPPRIAGRSPNLMFSVLDPHTRIPAHRGVANTRLVLHIPLIVPPDCAIRVGDETRPWVPGQALVFDDTFEHEAWNDSDERRAILLGDIWRPELGERERAVIAALMASPGV